MGPGQLYSPSEVVVIDKRVWLGLGALGAVGAALWWFTSDSSAASSPQVTGALPQPAPGQPGAAPAPLKLPQLPYPPAALAPLISERTVKVHHDVLQKGYVDRVNTALGQLHSVRQQQYAPAQRQAMRRELATSLAFDLGGAYLHDLYWRSMAPQERGGAPSPQLAAQIQRDFGSIGMLAQELTDVAAAMQGSGWSVLAWSPYLQRLVVLSVGNHDNRLPPGVAVLLPIDVWEHAYFLDRGPDRGAYLRQFWGLVNWNEVSQRFAAMTGQRQQQRPPPQVPPPQQRRAAPPPRAQQPRPQPRGAAEAEPGDELGSERRRQKRRRAQERARKREQHRRQRGAV
jgi:Fe-Mn family superoxide dismutase